MGKITKCSIIIYDDFKNVLIAEVGKGKRNSPEVWCIIGKSIKGKETEEKCITKAIDKALKCNVFELAPLKEYDLEEGNGDSFMVYGGKIRESVTCHADINKIKWISKNEIDMFDFPVCEKKALLDFFDSMK